MFQRFYCRAAAGLLSGVLVSILVLSLTGCGLDDDAPQVRYEDGGKTAVVTLKGQSYRLECQGDDNPEVPFEYSFEDDCEINIVWKGRVYDFDSPYDLADDLLVPLLVGTKKATSSNKSSYYKYKTKKRRSTYYRTRRK